MRGRSTAPLAAVLVAVSTVGLSGCVTQLADEGHTEPASATHVASAERECLVRAMYFESNRTSQPGLMAVGTVVMNRVKSGNFGDTICGVVGEPGQFASGVMTRQLNPAELPPVERAADAVLAGQRYNAVGDAMYFHSAAIKIPFQNIRYKVIAGGNAFYERVGQHATALASAADVSFAPSADGPTKHHAAIAVADATPLPRGHGSKKHVVAVADASPASVPKSASYKSKVPKTVAVASALTPTHLAAATFVSGPAVTMAKGCSVAPSQASNGLQQAALKCGVQPRLGLADSQATIAPAR